MAAITTSLERLTSRGKMKAEDRDAALTRIKPTTDLADLADCDIVIEAILEKYELKAAVIRELDATCRPDAVFATNTSSISVTHIAAASKAPDRVIGMHFFNPVPLMQLIEVIRALQTSDAVCDAVVSLAQSLGKSARVSKDSYGFVVNRVLIPMINEAINCAHEGVATPQDIDEMMKLGANHPMGPLALADLIGLDIVQEIMETLYEGFSDPKPSPMLKQMCASGYLGRKTGRGFFVYDKKA
jgi:3-hydroxybutyryl-CoA dehydrogenase